MPPYPIARKLFSQFGLDAMAAESVKSMLERERAREAGEAGDEKPDSAGGLGMGARRRCWPCWCPNWPGSASDC